MTTILLFKRQGQFEFILHQRSTMPYQLHQLPQWGVSPSGQTSSYAVDGTITQQCLPCPFIWPHLAKFVFVYLERTGCLWSICLAPLSLDWDLYGSFAFLFVRTEQKQRHVCLLTLLNCQFRGRFLRKGCIHEIRTILLLDSSRPTLSNKPLQFQCITTPKCLSQCVLHSHIPQHSGT